MLVKAATQLGLTGSLSREMLQRMAIEKSWPAATAPLFSDGCAVFEDYAMRGILGVAYLFRPDLELRPNASEYLRAPDKASYTLTLSTRASLISTVSGQEVGAIDFATPLDTLPPATLRDGLADREAGERLYATQPGRRLGDASAA